MTNKVILRDSFSQVLSRNASYDSPMNFQLSPFQNDLLCRLKVILRDSVSRVLSRNVSYDSPMTRASAYSPTKRAAAADKRGGGRGRANGGRGHLHCLRSVGSLPLGGSGMSRMAVPIAMITVGAS
jgi:hypothetical protein